MKAKIMIVVRAYILQNNSDTAISPTLCVRFFSIRIAPCHKVKKCCQVRVFFFFFDVIHFSKDINSETMQSSFTAYILVPSLEWTYLA